MRHDPWEPPFSHGTLASSGTGEYEKKFWAEIFRVTARRWNPTPLRGISTEIFAIVYSDITTLVFSENTPFVCQHYGLPADYSKPQNDLVDEAICTVRSGDRGPTRFRS
ncbi:hypothetical protein BHE74_00024331 [Ensete ventricosum]|nr:hypothetical protein GW17_00043233 [Ensete ventricosum]RWW68152.1 hypothetical protein BHE74_00024331 [Ensete ventricosum]RZR82248.1 hypothetical protein BHM03_00008619 [Ensete ventricosum]